MKKEQTPKKEKFQPKNATEKKEYKTLTDSFTYITNISNVIEEKHLDKNIKETLTLNELHVIEMVHKNNNKPLTYIASKLNVTVGSLMTCINRLVIKGYLMKYSDEMDKRITRVVVTDQVKKILKNHDQFHDEVMSKLLKKVSLHEASKVLNHLQVILSEYAEPVKDVSKKKEIVAKGKKVTKNEKTKLAKSTRKVNKSTKSK